MILNIDKFPFLFTYGRPRNSDPDLEPKNRLYYKTHPDEKKWLKELHADDEKYFYIEFMLDDAFHVFPLDTIMPQDLFDQLKCGEITLVVANSGHGYNQIMGGVYLDIIYKYNINPLNVIIRTESADMYEELVLITEHFNFPKCRLQWVRQFEYAASSFTKSCIIPKTLEIKNYDKKFLSYNGLYRQHRGAIIILLKCLDVLDKGIISFNPKNDFNEDSFEQQCINNILYAFRNNPEIVNLIENNKTDLRKLYKIELDDVTGIDTANYYDSHNVYYENTYFSLVTETSFPLRPFSEMYNAFTDTGRILSEKIFKPIVNKHPFIVVSNYQTLNLLKSLGYKSFSPYIDESYDDIKDDMLRLVAIAKEVKRLCELEGDDLNNFLNYCREVCEYNFNLLSNKNHFVTQLR